MDWLLAYAEIEMTIKQINPGRVPGLDGLPVELLKVKILSMLFDIITELWNGSPLSNDWVDSA